MVGLKIASVLTNVLTEMFRLCVDRSSKRPRVRPTDFNLHSIRYTLSTVQPQQNVLNTADRIILHKRKFNHITTDVQDRLHWLPVQQRIEYKVDKCLHQAAPTYLAELFAPVSESACHGHLRSAQGDLAVPCSRTQDTAKDVLLFLVQQSTLCASKDCYSAEHTKH